MPRPRALGQQHVPAAFSSWHVPPTVRGRRNRAVPGIFDSPRSPCAPATCCFATLSSRPGRRPRSRSTLPRSFFFLAPFSLRSRASAARARPGNSAYFYSRTAAYLYEYSRKYPPSDLIYFAAVCPEVSTVICLPNQSLAAVVASRASFRAPCPARNYALLKPSPLAEYPRARARAPSHARADQPNPRLCLGLERSPPRS